MDLITNLFTLLSFTGNYVFGSSTNFNGPTVSCVTVLNH